jgi:hypothetical protein
MQPSAAKHKKSAQPIRMQDTDKAVARQAVLRM